MDKKVIARNFSRYSDLYDNYCHVQNAVGLQLFSKIGDRRFKNILELGCGTGNLTNLLSQRFPEAKIKAVDISEKMLKVAESKINKDNIEFILADAEEIEFKEKFDLIISNASLQWFNDLRGVLNRYSDILDDGGLILFSIFGPDTYKELNLILKPLIKDKDIAAVNFCDFEELCLLFKNNFKACACEKEIIEKDFTSLNDLLKSIKYTGVRGEGLHRNLRFTETVLKRMERSYIEIYGKIKVTFEVFFCEARL